MKTIIFFLLSVSLSFAQIKIAVIGDYGRDGTGEAQVADLVKSWNPLRVVTVGDNNYEYGSEGTIDANIGKYYSKFIRYYKGNYRWVGTDGRTYYGSPDTNRFIPALGNHDGYNYSFAAWDMYLGSAITLSKLSGNNRYYNHRIGAVEFFIINSAYGNFTTLGRFEFEPHGIDSNSVQAQWLKNTMRNSTAEFKIVVMHHPPWSSVAPGYEDTYHILRWNFKLWGADLILSGHNHLYERINLTSAAGNNSGLIITINGAGGDARNWMRQPAHPGSVMQYIDQFGAQLLTVYGDDSLNCKFINIESRVIDSFTLHASGSPPPPLDTLRTLGDSVKVLWRTTFLR